MLAHLQLPAQPYAHALRPSSTSPLLHVSAACPPTFAPSNITVKWPLNRIGTPPARGRRGHSGGFDDVHSQDLTLRFQSCPFFIFRDALDFFLRDRSDLSYRCFEIVSISPWAREAVFFWRPVIYFFAKRDSPHGNLLSFQTRVMNHFCVRNNDTCFVHTDGRIRALKSLFEKIVWKSYKILAPFDIMVFF